MSSVELATMLERIASDNPGIRSVTVVRHGTVVLDSRISPFARGDRHDIHSCTKSVLSALVGVAIDKGDLPGCDTRVLDFFPDYEMAHLDADKRALTLGHLLTMSAGLKTEDSYLYDWVGLGKMRASRDWAQYILDLPIVTEPGTRFEYSNGVSQLIAIILQQATGQSVEAYAREHLFGPIGIVDYAWQGSGPDDSWGYSGLSLQPLDMARVGYLYLRGGEWNGVQVVPADWVQNSTSPKITAGTLAKSYGYQWWVDDDMFMMQGYGGQIVYVLPARDLVVVFTGALPEQQYFTPRSLLSNYIEAAVIADHALPANPATAARLDSLVRVLGSETREPLQPAPDLAQAISGRAFEFTENKMGLRRLNLHFTPGSSEAELEFVVGAAAGSLTIGLDGVFRISELYGQRWACRGRWVNGETFILEQEAPGKVLRRRATLTFQGDTLRFEVHDRVTDSVDIFSAKTAGAPPVAK
ncbi:MAG: beta-lactamase family protein [Candidatus Krumholzibacteria bacterium]|nr:beta-lactamase family protein [Candidatus Krumholzibacteria bacterium]